MLFKLFLIFLQEVSVFLFSNLLSYPLFEEDIKLFKVEGSFTEYLKSQFLKIFIKSSEPINSKSISQLEFFKGGVLYKASIDCFKNTISSDINELDCYIDFTKISFGKYKIKSFTYKSETKSSDVIVEIGEVSNKKISEMNLSYFNGEIREFQENQNFMLVFNTNIQTPSRLQRMKLINEQNKKYSIGLRCSRDDHSSVSVNCIGDFPLNPGKYQIFDILYYNGENDFEFINTKENLFFDVKEDILQLKRVYGEAHKEKVNIMGLIFKDTVTIKYFSRFFLRNTQTNQDYEIDYKFQNDKAHTSTDEKIVFDFSNIPIGKYYVNFEYKLHEHINTAVINILEIEKIDICYDDEGIDN